MNKTRIIAIAVVVVVLIIAGIFIVPKLFHEAPAKGQEQNATEATGQNQEAGPFEFGKVQSVFCGDGYSFVITEDGTLYGMGSNANGILGSLTELDIVRPVKILDHVQQVSCKGHALAVRDDGTLWGWGDNDDGELGTENIDQIIEPKQLMTDVKAAAAGVGFSVVLKTDGTVVTFGVNNLGQLGNGNKEETSNIVTVMNDVKSISCNTTHVFAVKNDNTLWGWGDDSYNALGFHNDVGEPYAGPERNIQTTPIKIMDNVKDAEAGDHYSAVLDQSGDLWLWGWNIYNRLAMSTEDYENYLKEKDPDNLTNDGDISSKPVKRFSDVVGFHTSYQNTGVIKSDGSLWLVGFNENGQIGNGTTNMMEVEAVKALDNVKDFSLSPTHCMAVKSDGTLYSWGSNEYGQLGTGVTTYYSEPYKIADNVASFSSGENNLLVLNTDGTLYASGNNGYGQLGTKDTLSLSTLTKITDNVQKAMTAKGHTLCLKKDGTLWAWGSNSYGQLGNGKEAKEAQLEPTKIMDDVKDIYCQGYVSVALKNDGSLWIWGWTQFGTLGVDGDTTVPQKFITGVDRIVNTTMVVKTDGALWYWDYNPVTSEIIYDPVKVIDNFKWFGILAGYYLIGTTDGSTWIWGTGYRDIGKFTGTIPEPEKLSDSVSLIEETSYGLLVIDKNGVLYVSEDYKFPVSHDSVAHEDLLEGFTLYKVTDNVDEVVYKDHFALIHKNDHSLWGLGSNDFGQFGDGKRPFIPTAVR